MCPHIILFLPTLVSCEEGQPLNAPAKARFILPSNILLFFSCLLLARIWFHLTPNSCPKCLVRPSPLSCGILEMRGRYARSRCHGASESQPTNAS